MSATTVRSTERPEIIVVTGIGDGGELRKPCCASNVDIEVRGPALFLCGDELDAVMGRRLGIVR